MKMKRQERPLVKLECLKKMARLRLNPAQTRMISRFVDNYLRLETQEKEVFQAELDRIELSQKEQWFGQFFEREMESIDKKLLLLLGCRYTKTDTGGIALWIFYRPYLPKWGI